MNPILPREHFVPDGEARVMPDGRLYLYGSYDISGKTGYCSDVLHVFSTDDMIHWTDHGVCFTSRDVPWAGPEDELYAPDCIHRDGKYYLYFCMRGNAEGVAVADTPWGPFRDPKPIKEADGDSIDPAVFIDDDGQAYYYWGQFSLRGAKLKDDMCTLDESTLNRNIIDEKRHGFHEGSSVRKRNGLYYLVYTESTRGRATCLGYGISTSPLGPFEHKGIIVDNMGCDPKTWNNHGSIAQFKGQWYVFYHRSSQNSEFNRRMCVEPIFFEEDGIIREVPCTTQGTQPPIPSLRGLDAADACRMGGWGTEPCLAPDPLNKGKERLIQATLKGWAQYRYVDFSDAPGEATLLLEADGEGAVEIWADDEVLGSVQISDTKGERKNFSTAIKAVEGVHTLYLEWDLKPGCTAAFDKISFQS